MTYNNVKETTKHRIVKVTIGVKHHSTADDAIPTYFWRLHAISGDTFALFKSKNPISSWRVVQDASLADEFESFMVEYLDEEPALIDKELEWKVDWIIQVVPDQLHPKYMRIVDIRESGNGMG